ncbi:MAG: hypothetical protein DRN83_01365 [Hadesarchaea archaeon]|nr:MAG: hypothetical protein DRN83_01365 [Hadesarchaea archaeon]HDI13064.1 hypothetical protein [Hadesarchaea archaeon]
MKRTKNIISSFLGQNIVRDIIKFFLLLGFFYFAMAGVLTLAFGTDSFWMAVISNSMKHEGDSWQEYFIEQGYDPSTFPIQGGFERGDLLIIQRVSSLSEISVGDVLILDRGPGVIPLTHRVVAIWEENGTARITTKGDANDGILLEERSIKPEQILGKVVFVIPKIGYISLWLSGQ